MPFPSPECPKQEQDIVFLIDGSGSISSNNFAKMLNFVKAVMSQFQRPNTQVCPWGKASVQGPLGRLAGGTLRVPEERPLCQLHAVLPVFPDAVLRQISGAFHFQRLRLQLRPTRSVGFCVPAGRVHSHSHSHLDGHVSPDFFQILPQSILSSSGPRPSP